eukprot:352941-Chlamydomonas_euryale.AAC.2
MASAFPRASLLVHARRAVAYTGLTLHGRAWLQPGTTPLCHRTGSPHATADSSKLFGTLRNSFLCSSLRLYTAALPGLVHPETCLAVAECFITGLM